MGLQAASVEAFDVIRERLVACRASDGFVTDFGPVLSIFFRDPDGLEAEVCVPNPDARPGVHNPPGTPAARYAPPATERPVRGYGGLRAGGDHASRDWNVDPWTTTST